MASSSWIDRPIGVLTLVCEASGASAFERRCVAHAIVNRRDDGRFGSSVAEVCLRRMQFSEWNGDVGDNRNLLRGVAVPAGALVLVDCQEALEEALSGMADPTGGATHYTDKSIAPPGWAVAPAIMSLETDQFRFYRNVP